MSAPVRATRPSALASGFLLGLAMPAVEAVATALSLTPQASSIAFLLALFVFFFAPVLLCVVGIEHLALNTRAMLPVSYWSSLGQVALRGLFWLIGTGMGFGIHAALGAA